MKKYQVTWGWQPPQYDRPKGNFRLFFHTEEVEREVTRKDFETGEETTETIHEWLCDVVEYEGQEAAEILRLIKEDKNSVECQRWLLNAKIEAYDSSKHVNEFSIQGINVWLDKDTRAGLLLRFQSESAMGKTDTTLWYGGMKFDMAIKDGIGMLYAIEVYASASYDCTQAHKAAKDSMTEGFEDYDYTANYPQKLAF